MNQFRTGFDRDFLAHLARLEREVCAEILLSRKCDILLLLCPEPFLLHFNRVNAGNELDNGVCA